MIGDGCRIPWHLPEDFAWFKKTTTGHIVVMGRKTFESIGKPLPDRETIVLSKTGFAHPGVSTIASLAELEPRTRGREVFICGGAQVYKEALPLCTDLYLTRVKWIAIGDAFFPAFEDQFRLHTIIRDTHEFTIEHWRKDVPKIAPTS